MRRKNLTVTEIFAFTGGLLGLFLGLSVVSFSEIVNALLQPLFDKVSKEICFRKMATCRKAKGNAFCKKIDKIKSYFSFFMKESSIHSFNFIGNASNCFERLFWFLSFSLSMTGCFVMVLQLYRKMDFKAVTLVIDDQLMDVSEIPFPAVTIFGRFPSAYKLLAPDIKTIRGEDSARWFFHYEKNRTADMNFFESAKHPTSR